MRRGALALCGVLAFAAPVAAGEVTSVEIVEYGLYTADVTGQLRDANGVISNTVENLCHIATTTTVPMRAGLHFGFRYRVDGPVPGDTAQVRLAIRFPSTVRPNPSVAPLTEHERSTILAVGAVSYTGYSFDQAWEFVPGTWTLEVRQGGRTLAAKSFTVIDSDEAPASSGAASCFKVS